MKRRRIGRLLSRKARDIPILKRLRMGRLKKKYLYYVQGRTRREDDCRVWAALGEEA